MWFSRIGSFLHLYIDRFCRLASNLRTWNDHGDTYCNGCDRNSCGANGQTNNLCPNCGKANDCQRLSGFREVWLAITTNSCVARGSHSLIRISFWFAQSMTVEITEYCCLKLRPLAWQITRVGRKWDWADGDRSSDAGRQSTVTLTGDARLTL
jgi:hypothetical protein